MATVDIETTPRVFRPFLLPTSHLEPTYAAVVREAEQQKVSALGALYRNRGPHGRVDLGAFDEFRALTCPIRALANFITALAERGDMVPRLPYRAARDLYWHAGNHDRLPVLLEWWEAGALTTRAAIRLVGEGWENFDNVRDVTDDVLNLIDAEPRPILAWMTARDRRVYEGLAPTVAVFRGADRNVNEQGLSWSLDSVVASRFPFLHRYRAANPVLVTGRVRREAIIAVKVGRSEKEIIVDPRDVEVLNVSSITVPDQQ